jgi:hypothetical protein
MVLAKTSVVETYNLTGDYGDFGEMALTQRI